MPPSIRCGELLTPLSKPAKREIVSQATPLACTPRYFGGANLRIFDASETLSVLHLWFALTRCSPPANHGLEISASDVWTPFLSKSDQFRTILVLSLCASTLVTCAVLPAQRPRFPDFFGSGGSSAVVPGNTGIAVGNQPPTLAIPNFRQTAAQSFGQPVAPAIANPTIGSPPVVFQSPFPAATQSFGQPVFNSQPAFSSGTLPNFQPPSIDPFQLRNQSFPGFPNGGAATQNFQIYPPANSQPLVGPTTAPPPVRTVPNFQAPAINRSFPNNNGQFGQPNIGRSGTTGFLKRSYDSFQNDFLPRLLERPRGRYTYMPGNNGNELDINEFEVATTLNFPDFASSGQPLLVSPGFIFHFWDGPDSSTGFDLPAQAYSAYLSSDLTTDTKRNFGLETNFTVGFYSDFDAVNSDSLRLTGKLLGWRRINSYIVGKLGVEYFDRVRTKLLPAFGLYATPTPDIKLDLFFPRSKLSHRIPNVNSLEVWAFIGGEYGGGSWTIERASGVDDQVDLNDVRAFMGLEWIGPKRINGFIEVGYAFERELVFQSDPINDFDLQDTILIRSGIAF